jgi:phospholipid transport system substrate-binding protein
MYMYRAYTWVGVGALLSGLWLVSVTSRAQAGEPQEKVRETIDAVLVVLQDKALQGPENTEKRRDKMRQAVFQRFGFEEMAQRALGQYWPKRTPAEKKEFTTVFGELLERSYINKIESYTGEQKVLYTKETVDKDYASVRTEIVVKRDANVEVVYQLLRHEGNWQVYDVVIEGVSLVNNYRTQFHNIISHESYEALLKKLKLKLEQERAAAPPIKG